MQKSHFTFRDVSPMKERLEQEAKKKHNTIGAIIRIALRKYFRLKTDWEG